MKKVCLFLLLTALVASVKSFGQTTLTEDANGVLNTNRIVAQTSGGQIFYVGHQLGSGYAMPSGIFRAWTDNTGGGNYFYDGLSGSTTTFSVRSDGQGYFATKIGIGTTTPNANLHVFGTAIIAGGNLDQGVVNTNFMANTGGVLVGWNRTSGAGETDFISNQGAGGAGGFAFYNHDNSNNETQLMWVLGNGQVLIGNTQGKQGNYLLAVAGSAVATSFTVKTVANWPDYVFKSYYHLSPLSNLRSYIALNHHLPDMPSEQQIAADGLNLGQMDKLLTKKIEELTLYLIEKDKQLNDEKAVISKQQGQIDMLIQQVSALQSKVK